MLKKETFGKSVEWGNGYEKEDFFALLYGGVAVAHNGTCGNSTSFPE